MLRKSTGRLKALVPEEYVKNYWQIPSGTHAKQSEVDMFISHIFEIGLQNYELKGGENVQNQGV
jgi:hypothetical protein